MTEENPFAAPQTGSVPSIHQPSRSEYRSAGIGLRLVYFGIVISIVGTFLIGPSASLFRVPVGSSVWHELVAALFCLVVQVVLLAGCAMVFFAHVIDGARWLLLICLGLQGMLLSVYSWTLSGLGGNRQFPIDYLFIFSAATYIISAICFAIYMKRIAVAIEQKSLIQLIGRIIGVFVFLLISNPLVGYLIESSSSFPGSAVAARVAVAFSPIWLIVFLLWLLMFTSCVNSISKSLMRKSEQPAT